MAKYRDFKGDLIGYEYINNLIECNFETGELYWKELSSCEEVPVSYHNQSLDKWNTKKAGKRCETTMPDKNYIRYGVKVHTPNFKSVNFYARRIAWLLYYGEWPDCYVDHRDGDATNNSIHNLRESKYSNNRNIPQKARRGDPRFGVKFNGIKKNGMPSYTAWGRTYNKKRSNGCFTLLNTEDLFEAICARISWENTTLKNPFSGYTLRHFGREH